MDPRRKRNVVLTTFWVITAMVVATVVFNLFRIAAALETLAYGTV